jgi:hypothetical protein
MPKKELTGADHIFIGFGTLKIEIANILRGVSIDVLKQETITGKEVYEKIESAIKEINELFPRKKIEPL